MIKVNDALGFLKEPLYDKESQLCREDLGGFWARYWTCSDNVLAWRAFDLMGEPTYRDSIYKRLNAITIPCAAKHVATINHLHDPIISEKATIDDPPGSDNCYSIDPSNWAASPVAWTKPPSSGIFHEDHKGGPFNDYADPGLGNGYANLCFLEAISYRNQGNSTKASSLFRSGMDKWDSKKGGFNDMPYAKDPSRYFDTYKLALSIISSIKVNGALPEIYSVLDAKLTQQQGSNGGIYSKYTATANKQGSENCETTAMAIIAYKLQPKKS
ncbi:MAG: hypothetical protein ACHQ03_08675 [Candidatus Bathyarchaeia archaeon]